MTTTCPEINTDRNAVIERIRMALRGRSGKVWSVTGGRGTAWGWITIDAPPARRTAHWIRREGTAGNPEDYEDVDTGEKGGDWHEQGRRAKRYEQARRFTHCIHGNRKDLGACPDCANTAMQRRQRPADRARFRAQLARIKGR